MTPDLLITLDRIPSEPKTVLMYLLARAELETKVGLTQQEVSRATRLSVGAVRESLGWLETPSYHDAALKSTDPITPFIAIKKSGKYYKLTLLVPYVPENKEIAFTFEDTDDRRLASLEKEVQRLATRGKQTSKLSLYLKGERKQLVAEIESDLGRPLKVEEAFLVGGMVDRFGPERVKLQWRRKAPEMDRPVVGLYAMFMNSAFGKGIKIEEKVPEIKYAPIIRED